MFYYLFYFFIIFCNEIIVLWEKVSVTLVNFNIVSRGRGGAVGGN